VRVHDAMKTGVQIASPDQSIAEAAKMMARIDAGVLPVGENDRLVGMITDRDIAIRGVAMDKAPDTLVRDVMSKEVCYCYEDQDIDEVAENMADLKVRRMPVLNRDKRLIGMLSLGDIARSDGHDGTTAMALSGISEPGGEHSQTGGDSSLTRTLG
jgi:CBS domain-containing protein